MRGYKVFGPDWTCRGFQFEVGKTYEENVTPLCCKRGFHFCTELNECFNYYLFDSDNKVAEVEALGDIDTELNTGKHCTNKIRIVRELSWEEVLKKVNMGKANAGFRNSGNCNSGDYNSGNYNSGDCNSDDCNSGDCNSGNHNSGSRNSGYCNSGYCNSGNYNSGDYNSGYFNSNEPNVRMFNKQTNLKFDEITIPDWCFFDLTVWVSYDTATEEEKEEHKKEIETCGGFLKTLEYKEAWRLAWDKASKEEHKELFKLPNWDNKVFKKITGIDAELEIAKENKI